MSDLPPGWEWSTLEDLAAAEPRAMTDGPFGSNLKSSHYVDSGPRVIRLQNIGFGDFIDEKAHITEQHFESLRAHEARAGDLVVASLGQDLPRTCVVPSNVGPAIVKADCIRVRLHPTLDARYVNYALQRPELRHAVAEQIHGVGRPRLGMTGIKSLSIPLAPRREQQSVATAIEEHLSRLDAAIAAAGSARRRLYHAQLSLAEALIEGSGPLVPVAQFAEASKNAMAIGPFGSNLKVSDYREDGVPLVFVRDIRRGRFGGEGTRYVSPEKAGELGSHIAREGDILVTKMGDPPGDAVVYRGQDAVITADCIKLTPAGDVHAPFVAAALGTRRARSEVLSITKGVAQKKVSLGRFKAAVCLPKPDFDTQVEIAARLAEPVDGFGRLNEAVAAIERRSTALRRSVLAAAFSGQLVPPDPDDEPASVLLERIRAERAAATPTKRTRKAKAS